MNERYFYHCFPRRYRRRDNTFHHGLRVLESMIDHGLLLTPEILEWRESLSDGTVSPPMVMCQVRACFTELSPWEVANHAKEFGPFVIEFDIEKLRLCGAIPTIYLPQNTGSNGLEGVAGTLVARLGDAINIVSRLDQILDVARGTADQNELVLYLGRDEFRAECSAGIARRLLGILTLGTQPPGFVANGLAALAAFFYPTDNRRQIDLLGYYRQREWRIIGDIAKHGVVAADLLTPEQAEQLCKLDEEFFLKELRTWTEQFRTIDRCRYLRLIDGKHMLGYARRVLVPEEALSTARELMRRVPGGPAVDILFTDIASLRKGVQQRAFEIWQQHGEHGNDHAHWFAARRQFDIPDDVHV
jgi:hypothetical protein